VLANVCARFECVFLGCEVRSREGRLVAAMFPFLLFVWTQFEPRQTEITLLCSHVMPSAYIDTRAFRLPSWWLNTVCAKNSTWTGSVCARACVCRGAPSKYSLSDSLQIFRRPWLSGYDFPKFLSVLPVMSSRDSK
jgi:hypothetical protein